MRVFLTGVTGYIGGTVALRLTAAGHQVRGLTRDPGQADALRRLGIAPVIGSLDDAALLMHEAQAADAVVNAASSDHDGAADALIAGLAGSGKLLLHTSGSSIVADTARGAASERVYDETTPLTPRPERAARVALDRRILAAAVRGLRPVVLCNTLIYGAGRGLHRDSVQLPDLIRQAKASGVVRHVGAGENIWSTVHLDDVAELYLLALDGSAQGFFFVEAGEASFASMAAAIARALGLGAPQPWPFAEAAAYWGAARADVSLGSNSRVRGRMTRVSFAWRPKGEPVLAWLEHTAATIG